MSYQPKSYRKFLSGELSASVVSSAVTPNVNVITTEAVLESYVKDILENGGTPIIAQGTSMTPLIQPNNLIQSTPLDRKYITEGSIYMFKEGDTQIIKRLVRIDENVVQHGMRGTNYIFEGDNRETSIDKKVFVANSDSIKNVFVKIHVEPNIPVDNNLVNQLKRGNCMSENLKNPQLKAETIEMIQGNEDLMNFIQDLKAITHNNALRVYEMSCILDGTLNMLKTKGIVNTDEMWNFINISTNQKEWQVQTGEFLPFDQFFEKFYSDLTLEDLKTERHRRDFQSIIDAYNKAKSN